MVSALDPKRRPLSIEAASAREQSQHSLSTRSAEAKRAEQSIRYVPRISASDTDQMRDLKRVILAKEQEITAVCNQLNMMADRLDRALEIFLAAAIEHDAANVSSEKTSEQRVKAFEVDVAKAIENTAPKQKKVSTSSPTSLEAILAAARGNQPNSAGGKPKYSKLIRDMK